MKRLNYIPERMVTTDACGTGALISQQDHTKKRTATSDRKLRHWDSTSTSRQ